MTSVTEAGETGNYPSLPFREVQSALSCLSDARSAQENAPLVVESLKKLSTALSSQDQSSDTDGAQFQNLQNRFIREVRVRSVTESTCSELRETLHRLKCTELSPTRRLIVAQDIEAIALRSVQLSEIPPLLRWVCPDRVDIATWSSQKVQEWLERNDLGDLKEVFHSVIGLDLLEQNLPCDSIPSDLLERFEFSWHQLLNTSGDIFDTDSFTSAEAQIGL